MYGTQEPDVYFYGDKVEKIGEKKYRITHGGFTTCVQPTPRWKLTSGTVTIRLEHYAILTNSLFRVKGVPVLYLPIFYYPVKKDDRATGFLIPTYGSSTVRGQSLSQRVLLGDQPQPGRHVHARLVLEDRAGLRRRVPLHPRAPAPTGYLRLYNLREHEASYLNASGTETVTPARTSYEVRGTLSQRINKALRARGRVDYFSSLAVQQTYHMNVYDASRTQRVLQRVADREPRRVHHPRQRRPERVLLRDDEFEREGRAAAHQPDPRRAAALRRAGLPRARPASTTT